MMMKSNDGLMSIINWLECDMNLDWRQVLFLVVLSSLTSLMLSSLFQSSRILKSSSASTTKWTNILLGTQCRHHHRDVSTDDYEVIKAQAVAMLRQKQAVLTLLTDSDYTQKIPAVYNSSVGGHIRHSLDHFQAILNAINSSDKLADYDTRKRNTDIESNRQAALQSIQHILNIIPSLSPNEEISVSFIGNDTSFTTFVMPSYVARELSFASHHAIHHMSMVKLIMQAMQYDFPKDSGIGIAPSTAKDIKNNNLDVKK